MPTKKDKLRHKPRVGKAEDSQYNENNSITVGNITGGTGFAIGHGAQTTIIQGSEIKKSELVQIFKPIRKKIAEASQGPDKSVAENALNALEVEAQKGDLAVENNVQRWMNFLADTMPDAWEIAIDTFLNPIKGIGTVFKKVAERAKVERDAKNAKASKK